MAENQTDLWVLVLRCTFRDRLVFIEPAGSLAHGIPVQHTSSLTRKLYPYIRLLNLLISENLPPNTMSMIRATSGNSFTSWQFGEGDLPLSLIRTIATAFPRNLNTFPTSPRVPIQPRLLGSSSLRTPSPRGQSTKFFHTCARKDLVSNLHRHAVEDMQGDQLADCRMNTCSV